MGHTYANLLIHVVFSTKNRRAAIKEAWRQRLYEYMAGIARHEFGRALSLGGTDNHLHGLLSVQPSVALSDASGSGRASARAGSTRRFLPRRVSPGRRAMPRSL
ncbi:transposase [bacterium]|nr:transposase [bacterium]